MGCTPAQVLPNSPLPPPNPSPPPPTTRARSARDAAFLDALAQLRPDLCVTAAYGNMLPSAFLSIPKHGTLNIHPSLLPLYRGAAPVQRALQVGRGGAARGRRGQGGGCGGRRRLGWCT